LDDLEGLFYRQLGFLFSWEIETVTNELYTFIIL